jgi:hypothetical protein
MLDEACSVHTPVKEILTFKTFKGLKKQVACGTGNKLTGIKSEDYTQTMVKSPMD